MFTAKIAHVLKLCLPTPVIEVILSNKIEYIRYYNIESTKNKKLKLRCFIVILLTFCFSYIFIY